MHPGVLAPFGWDEAIVRFCDAHYGIPVAVAVARAYLVLGMAGGGAFALALLVVLLAQRRFGDGAVWTLSLAGAVGSSELLKELFRRPPLGDNGGGYSFPSGNAAASAAAVVALAFLVRSRRTRAAAVVAGTVAVPTYGAALVYLGWHYPSDVVGGWCLGFACATALALTRTPARPLPRAVATALAAARARAARARGPSSPPASGSRR